MPAANIMATQPVVENSGCSPSRPNRMCPSDENARAIMAMKNTTAEMMNAHPSVSTSHVNAAEDARPKPSGTAMAHTAMASTRISAGAATPQSMARAADSPASSRFNSSS